MIQDNLIRRELTIGTLEANIKAMIFVAPAFFIFGVPYFLLWKQNLQYNSIISFSDHIGLVFTLLISGTTIHELIHGIFWSFYLKNGFRSIKFGMIWKYLTPYCHSKEPLKVKHYMLGAVMPGVLLGFIPSLIAILTGNIGLLAFGFFFTIGAGGDFLIIWMLRNENKNNLVQDHPSKIGCYLYDKNQIDN